MKHLEQHNSLTDSQNGFRAKRSTETQLIQTIHVISKSLDKKETVDMAILDFTKAFHKMPHKRLIHKLNYYEISGSIATWIERFLTRRTQQVVVNGATSSSTMVYPREPFLGSYFSFFTYTYQTTYLQMYGSFQIIAFYIHLSEHKMTLPYCRTIYLNGRNGKTPGL